MPQMIPAGHAAEDIDVDKQHVGRIIGKQGQTIRGLQASTGANISIDQVAFLLT